MRHTMIVEVGAGGEALATDLALVRFLARMDPPVGVQGGRCGKRFATHVTRVGLLSWWINKHGTVGVKEPN